jgi:hypothetical protein
LIQAIRKTPHLKENSEQARQKDDKKESVPVLRSSLQVNPPIPTLLDQTTASNEKTKGNSSRVEICNRANEANAGVFGQVEGDDIISFA